MQDCEKKKMKLESILRKLKKKENEKYKKKQAEVDKLQSKKIKLLEENEILEICIAANIKILRIRMEKLEEKNNWINAEKTPPIKQQDTKEKISDGTTLNGVYWQVNERKKRKKKNLPICEKTCNYV